MGTEQVIDCASCLALKKVFCIPDQFLVALAESRERLILSIWRVLVCMCACGHFEKFQLLTIDGSDVKNKFQLLTPDGDRLMKFQLLTPDGLSLH